jgi:hypothetical protein
MRGSVLGCGKYLGKNRYTVIVARNEEGAETRHRADLAVEEMIEKKLIRNKTLKDAL